MSVVEIKGDVLRVRQAEMIIGQQYHFVYFGVPCMAIKRKNGNVDFYHTGLIVDSGITEGE